ncbi:hypothetical protein THAOC_25964, partial [Thalassiosira oceanica]
WSTCTASVAGSGLPLTSMSQSLLEADIISSNDVSCGSEEPSTPRLLTRLPLPPGLGPDLAAANVLGDCLRGDAYTGPPRRGSQRRLPPDCRGTQVHSSFRRARGIVRQGPGGSGGAPVAENEREAGPPVDRAAPPRPRSLRLPTPCSEVKILKIDEDGALSQPPSDCVEGDTSASCVVRTASRRPRNHPRRDSQNGRGNTTSSAGARRSIRSRTRSADNSMSRSTVGSSGGSGSIGSSGEGARRSSSLRRVRPGNLGNDGDQGPSPSQRSRLTDRTSMDEDIEINQLLRHVTQGGSQTHHAGDEAQLWELNADYAVNLECITHVSNTKIEVRPEHTITEKERHPGTAPDSISGLYAANFRLLYSAYLMIQTHSYQFTPLGFAYRLPIRPHWRSLT